VILIHGIISSIGNLFDRLGDWSLFSCRVISSLFSSSVRASPFLTICYKTGVQSAIVIMLTGLFIGMVLALQAYEQFHPFGMDSLLGSITITGILTELGPVLTAVMFAGRVGCAIAAELGTLKVTEQIDALACLGVDPIGYLASSRFLACLLLIPFLTVLADVAGIVGSTILSIQGFGVDPYHYWRQSLKYVGLWQLMTGLVKSIFFGAVVALISCYQGFRCRQGAEGVGNAATKAFVNSFIAILVIDFFLVYLFNILRPIIQGDIAAPE
jgi:phospholipid/cholesterol/gamma-HCH transport system permease protein